MGVITSVYVCVGEYQKSSLFFCLLFLFLNTVFCSNFYCSILMFWKSFMDMRRLSETMPMTVTGVQEERGACVIDYLFYFCLNLIF